LRTLQALYGVLEQQPFLLEPPELKLIHVNRVLELPDRSVQVAVFLFQLGDLSCQIDVDTLCGLDSAFLLL
jgi:hypothetical protein